MVNRTETLSDAQLRAIKWIKNKSAVELGQLGSEIGRMLAELTAEVADAKLEALHWKDAFEETRKELKVLASVAIAQSGQGRLVITRKELNALPPDTQLYVEGPEEGVRVYELRRVSEGVNGSATRQ
jgi:hypothetical protein